jgi:DNA invertase Pin-like site-specific DNA recombinase
MIAGREPARRHRAARNPSPRPAIAESANLQHFTTLLEEFQEHSVTLDVVAAPGLGAAAVNKLTLSILASFAEFERDLAASRIAEARGPISKRVAFACLITRFL